MVNNFGGGEFHYSTTFRNDPTMDLHTSAAHGNTAEGWVKSVGFEYIPVRKGDDYGKALDVFLDGNRPRPVFVEFFSDMETDATITRLVESENRKSSAREKAKEAARSMARKMLGGGTIGRIKKAMGKA